MQSAEFPVIFKDSMIWFLENIIKINFHRLKLFKGQRFMLFYGLLFKLI